MDELEAASMPKTQAPVSPGNGDPSGSRGSRGRVARRRALAIPLVIAAVAVVGCGGDDDSDGASAATTAVGVPAKPAPPAQRETVLKDSLVEGTARGKKDNRFYVRSVTVDGGDVRVRTGGYPEGGAGAAGRGACNWIAGAEEWMETIEVVGEGGTKLATWKADDKRCSSSSDSR